MSEKLKSCPFCGGRDIRIMGSMYAYVYCAACGVEGPLKPTREGAATAWNTRAGEKS